MSLIMEHMQCKPHNWGWCDFALVCFAWVKQHIFLDVITTNEWPCTYMLCLPDCFLTFSGLTICLDVLGTQGPQKANHWDRHRILPRPHSQRRQQKTHYGGHRRLASTHGHLPVALLPYPRPDHRHREWWDPLLQQDPSKRNLVLPLMWLHLNVETPL